MGNIRCSAIIHDYSDVDDERRAALTYTYCGGRPRQYDYNTLFDTPVGCF